MNTLSPRLPVMALLLVLGSSRAAWAQETQRQYLSGHDKDDAVPWNFFCTTGAQSGFWTNLSVPSNWELHGFGTLNYKKDAANPPPERGLYQRSFNVPSDWNGQRVFLVFESVMTDTEAKINGQIAGPVHQGGFYRFKYEVTHLLSIGGSNLLEVAVDKHSANTSINNAERLADYWVFGGIYRPVYLEAVPQEYIRRVAIDARADGRFSMDVYTGGVTNADLIEAQITSLDGTRLGEPFASPLTRPADTLSATGGEGQGEGALPNARSGSPAVQSPSKSTLKTFVDSPRQWTAETPNLYRVEVLLKQGSRVIHRIEQQFGFRTIEVRNGDGIYVNGHRVVLKGANRHSFWPDSGRALSTAVHRMDIEAMKDMNMNAVRMSHYPPDAEFLDLCDQLGLYVLDELAGWHKHYDNEIGPKLVEEMVTRDVNHPSILFWDNGNEGGFNTNLDALFAQFDPQQRRVLHPWAPFNGFCTAHYLAYDKAKIAATGESVYFRNNEEYVDVYDTNEYIYMPTEFSHGLYDGGAGAGLEDLWNLMRGSKVLGGGFIWALLDEGVLRPDTGKIDLAGNQAPDGILGPYRQKEGSFYTIKELWSPIVIAPDNNGTLMLENRYDFTDASQCKLTWQLRKFPAPRDSGAGFTVIAEGTASVPNVPPGSRAPVKMKLPPDWKNADALALHADDPNGRELWTWVWPMPRLEVWRTLANDSSQQASLGGDDTNDFHLNFRGLAVSISKQTGFLTDVQRDGQKFSLANGPRLAVGSATLTNIATNTEGGDVLVTANYAGDLKQVTWRLRSDGWLKCDYTYTASGPQDYCGVVFDYPENLVKHKRWLGDGPYRVWKNRLAGTSLSVWENDYNNTITGYADWVYPEFKGCFASVYWMQLNTTEGDITAVPTGKDLFVQVLTPQQPPTNMVGQTLVKLPQCGLGFLNAIPPIGSKFKPARETGPQGQTNMLNGEFTGSVSFYFGRFP